MSEGTANLKGVEIFATGSHRGKHYTLDDLQQMVDNFRRHSTGTAPLLRVPGVLGHDEDQHFLERSDLPAAAWGEHLYVEMDAPSILTPPLQKTLVGLSIAADAGDPLADAALHDFLEENGLPPEMRGRGVLVADFSDVPPEVKRLLDGKTYRKVSAEIYDSPPAGIPGTGKMLRRVAFLGGDVPQVKGLRDIPSPTAHAEAVAGYRPVVLQFSNVSQAAARGTWLCYSEVKPMDRAAMLACLQKNGMATTIPDTVPDEVLADMCRALEAKSAASAAGGTAPMAEPAVDQATLGLIDPKDTQGMPADEPGKTKYRERFKKLSEHLRKMSSYCGKMSDEDEPAVPAPAAAATPTVGTDPPQPMSTSMKGAAPAQAHRHQHPLQRGTTRRPAHADRRPARRRDQGGQGRADALHRGTLGGRKVPGHRIVLRGPVPGRAFDPHRVQTEGRSQAPGATLRHGLRVDARPRQPPEDSHLQRGR